MDQLLALARRNTYILAVLYMDLDRFKFINDTMGHDAGDQLLKEVAKRLTTSTRKSDTVARMGGDEFISICAKITAPEDAGSSPERSLQPCPDHSIYRAVSARSA